jgi:DNA-binding transcriptional MerR regulator
VDGMSGAEPRGRVAPEPEAAALEPVWIPFGPDPGAGPSAGQAPGQRQADGPPPHRPARHPRGDSGRPEDRGPAADALAGEALESTAGAAAGPGAAPESPARAADGEAGARPKAGEAAAGTPAGEAGAAPATASALPAEAGAAPPADPWPREERAAFADAGGVAAPAGPGAGAAPRDPAAATGAGGATAPTPPAPDASPHPQASASDAADGGPIPLPAVAERLAISPYALRSLLDEYADLVPVTRQDADRTPALAPEAVRRLRFIAAARAQGLAHEEVRRRLQDGGEGPAGADVLLDRLEQLQAELAQSERRRVEDRDRLLLALMRTQQEIQHLRVEMAGPRRSRRKGLWQRLFGG